MNSSGKLPSHQCTMSCSQGNTLRLPLTCWSRLSRSPGNEWRSFRLYGVVWGAQCLPCFRKTGRTAIPRVLLGADMAVKFIKFVVNRLHIGKEYAQNRGPSRTSLFPPMFFQDTSCLKISFSMPNNIRKAGTCCLMSSRV